MQLFLIPIVKIPRKSKINAFYKETKQRSSISKFKRMPNWDILAD